MANDVNITTLTQGDLVLAPRTKTSAVTDTNGTDLDTLLANKQGTISDLATIRSNATAGAGAATTISTYGNIVTHNTSEFATAAQGATADSALQPEDVVNSVTSTATNAPLSANMGKELQDQIEHLKARGRFLSIWNATTGLPTTAPTQLPYDYKTGDYYVVGTVGETNYKPTGTQYTGASSTTVESGALVVNDMYFYDSSAWTLLHTEQPTVAFSTLAGSPYDNANLTTALNAKQDTLTAGTRISITNNTVSTSASEVSVSATGTSTDSVKYITINGQEKKIGSDAPTEYTTKLQEDLYTYTPIGKITGATQTNPVKVADAGDPLKDVFNAILGTEVDVDPTINQSGTTFTKSAQTGTTTVSGAEIGQAIAAQTGTVTYTVTNTATCSYGLKTANYDTYNKTSVTTFNYPIKQRTINSSTYEVRIKYPELNGCTLSVTTGTLVFDDTTNRYLYVNTANKQIVVSIAIPAGTSTAAAQTRFNQLEADVEFDNAQYNGENVLNFWTYLKNSYTVSGMSHGAITGVKSIAYTITKGTRYAYSKVTSATTAPTSGLTKQSAESTFGTDGADFSYSVGDYIYLYRTSGGKTVYTYVLGQWAAVTFTELAPVTITQANGATCTYYPYQVGPMEASGSAKYRV